MPESEIEDIYGIGYRVLKAERYLEQQIEEKVLKSKLGRWYLKA